MPLCVHLLPDTDAAGAENQALSLLSELRERPDLDLELVHFGIGRNHERFEALGIPIRELGRRARLSLDFPRRVRALRRLYGSAPPDILHTWLFEANVVGLWAARRWPRTQVVIAQRSGTMERTMPSHLRAARMVLGRADFAIANSPEGAELLRDLGLDAGRIAVVPQGIAADRLAVERAPDQVRAAVGVDPAAPLLVTVGRADGTKDYPGLMVALELVRAARPGTALVLVGPTAEEMRALGVDLPGGVHAVGWQDRPGDFMNAADVVVIPSWTEGHSNVAGEALMLGRPVATTDTGAHPAIVAEAGGRVVPIRRPDLLADAALELLAAPPDPAAVRAVARERLDADQAVERTWQVYQGLLDGRRAS